MEKYNDRDAASNGALENDWQLAENDHDKAADDNEEVDLRSAEAGGYGAHAETGGPIYNAADRNQDEDEEDDREDDDREEEEDDDDDDDDDDDAQRDWGDIDPASGPEPTSPGSAV